MKRRTFLKGSLCMSGLAALGCGRPKQAPPRPAGERVDPNFVSGHLLRDGQLPELKADARTSCQGLILGGGISGLSAAWRWRHAGLEDFQVLELEADMGGNSRALSYPASKAPIGAHYLPIPNLEARAVRRVLAEMGILKTSKDGTLELDGRHLCHSPQERIFQDGSWHQGLLPEAPLDAQASEQVRAFRQHIRQWREQRDSQGRKIFALPLHYSSREEKYLQLDRVSFSEYAAREGWTDPALLWFLEYACRDDFGASMENCSAWAGLHYFASRDGGGLGGSDDVLVWPEGNQRLAAHLAKDLQTQLRPRSLVLSVQSEGRQVVVDYLDLQAQERRQIVAEVVVCCLPTFVRAKLFSTHLPGFEYAPWLTANLSLRSAPDDREGRGFVAWDNVIRDSASLGYVVATHQQLAQDPRRPTVWTWYRPFVEQSPKEAREALLEAKWETWADTVLGELEEYHKDIRELCERLDITILGHGMVRPSPGLIWGADMENARRPRDGVFFGHGDLSGMSLFEESQFRGVLAAEQALSHLGQEVESFL